MNDSAPSLRILYIIRDLDVGGTEGHVNLLTSELKKRNHAPEIFSLGAHGALTEEIRENGIRVHEARFGLTEASLLTNLFCSLFLCAELFVFLIRRKFDVVHFFLPAGYLIGAPIALLCGCRHLIMSRRSLNTYQQRYPRIIRAFERALHRRMSAVLGNSAQVVSELIDDEGVDPAKTRIIYNGVDSSGGPAKGPVGGVSGLTTAAKDTVTLVIVANLLPYKGHRDLLDALAVLDISVPWRLLIVGRDDGIGADLKTHSAEQDLGENVQFLGPQSQEAVRQILSIAHIGILASHEEGFSNALLEYMAAGLPVIATDVGGNGEAVIPQETGLLVPARDPKELSAAIATLILDPETRRRMGAAGKARATETFSVEACVSAYEDLYRGLRTPAA